MSDHPEKLRLPFGKLTSIFPQIILPNNHNQSMGDFIQKIVKQLPVPTDLEINTAILSMKKVVDTQEMDIQMQMIRQEQQNINPHQHSEKQISQFTLIQEPVYEVDAEYQQSQRYQEQSHQHYNKDWKWTDDKDYYDFLN